ncbi:MAG TPA: hypothetical protein VFU38_00260 [Candidatus Krumholzibacteria bacterium]|nr:hypothetical protein [Candidatus Krumholzibacteria bacterium]
MLLGLFSVCMAPACYTLVQHPGIARRNYQRPAKGVPCTSCHTNQQLLAFVQSDRLARERAAWDELNHPWWIDARLKPDSAAVDSSGASP